MSRPAVLVDNLLNTRTYPGHTLTASSTESGTSVRSLSSGRRRRDLGGWKASDLNTDAYVRCTFDQPRAFDCLWIDRDNVLMSVNVALSDDGWATELALVAQVPPSYPSPNTRLRSGQMSVTEEGCLVWYLGLQVAHEVEVRFPAMGAGLRPELAGMMLGKLWGTEHAAQKPFDFMVPHVEREQFQSPRRGSLEIWTSSPWEAEIGGLHIEDLYATRRHGMVTFPGDEAAERAVFGFCPDTAVGFRLEPGREWSWPRVEIPVEETEPVIR